MPGEDLHAELAVLARACSHELRSPLGAVLNSSEILRADHGLRLDRIGLECLSRIERSAKTALAKLEALELLLDLAQRPLAPEPLDAGALACEVFRDVVSARGAGAVELRLSGAAHVWADRDALRRALGCLLDNALKFGAAGQSARVELDGEARGDWTWIRVRDHGIGFDMRHERRIFRPFERLHPSDCFPGAGAGLAIAARVAGRHGGRIWAESAPGHGATFTLVLPRREP